LTFSKRDWNWPKLWNYQYREYPHKVTTYDCVKSRPNGVKCHKVGSKPVWPVSFVSLYLAPLLHMHMPQVYPTHIDTMLPIMSDRSRLSTSHTTSGVLPRNVNVKLPASCLAQNDGHDWQLRCDGVTSLRSTVPKMSARVGAVKPQAYMCYRPVASTAPVSSPYSACSRVYYIFTHQQPWCCTRIRLHSITAHLPAADRPD
jgi:hypothetical protein